MRLIKRSLRGRTFLLQFQEIMAEFGHEIPWLEPLHSLKFSTNATYFRDKLLRGLNCEEEEIVPFQLITSDESMEYVGGMLYFPKSPERFKDKANQCVEEVLSARGYCYTSCLQIRDVFQKKGYGSKLMKKALHVISADFGQVWGVVSDLKTARFYENLGAKIQSPLENKDRLWIVSW